MARLTLVLAGLIAVGCASRATGPRAVEPSPVGNAKAEPSPAGDGPLGLAEGATWQFTGSQTSWDDTQQRDVSEPLAVTTKVVSATTEDGRQVFHIEGWPADGGGMDTVITIVDGIVYLGEDDNGEAWLRLPLAEGDGPGCIPDEPYCWRVEASGTGFDVIYRTNPDVTIYHLEPGRGVTRYEYIHHGTTNEILLERVND